MAVDHLVCHDLATLNNVVVSLLSPNDNTSMCRAIGELTHFTTGNVLDHQTSGCDTTGINKLTTNTILCVSMTLTSEH